MKLRAMERSSRFMWNYREFAVIVCAQLAKGRGLDVSEVELIGGHDPE